MTSPLPEMVLLLNLFTIPPITMVGLRSAAVNISPNMEQVVVFPWVPAMAILVGFTFKSSASISARRITGTCLLSAAVISGLLS